MFVYILLVLGTWNGVMGTDEMCDSPSNIACSMPRETRFFPKTEADVDLQCPSVAQHLDCLKNYADKCGYENVHHPFSEDRYQTLKKLVEDICQKDSQLHLSIVQVIGCLSDLFVLFQEECGEYLQNKTTVLTQYIRNKEVEAGYNETTYDSKLWMSFTCLGQSLSMVCLASRASEKCGSKAYDVMREVVARSEILKDDCPSVVEDQINELIGLLELELKEEQFLHDIIRK